MTTPMQQQYNKIKSQYKDYIVLFRLGDFYEAFNEDAETLSKILGITLTGRGKDQDRIPMAGIPHHALNNYIPKILENKFKIAIADQLEEAKPGKLVDRQITRIITPGTITDEKLIEDGKNNYIACIEIDTSKDVFCFSLAYSDITTGEVYEYSDSNFNSLQKEILKINPSEIIIKNSLLTPIKNLLNKFFINSISDNYVNYQNAIQTLKKTFRTKNLRSIGIDEEKDKLQVLSLGTLFSYLANVQKKEIEYIKKINKYNYSENIQIDFQTIKNLEILYSVNQNPSLYDVLNACCTSMGKRLLRQRIVNPFKKSDVISKRLESAKYFFDNFLLVVNVRDTLKNLIDIQRFISKIGLSTINPKEVYYLKLSLEKIIDLYEMLKALQNLPIFIFELFDLLNKNIYEINEIINKITFYLQDDPSTDFGSGFIINKNVNTDLDKFVELKNNTKNYILQIQQREIQRTGIQSLKISFNQVFGYFIEVTKTNLNKVPQDYIRKQTLVNAERFITQEIKELEEQILNADIEIQKLENEIFNELKSILLQKIDCLNNLAYIISEIDILTNFAFLAKDNNYCLPKISSEQNIIKNGRHPIIEKLSKKYIPNNTNFETPIHLITGPNMAGKSTYIRGVALIYLMAQIGSFVPADDFVFTPVDNIFTRIGSGDNLAKGESTFMVEMIETANILNNATKDSLIILDEVGRGTSTYDGVAIAWSIVEYIVQKIKSKTLFATHYHELINLEKKFSSYCKNYKFLIKEENNNIEFLYKITEGYINKSYGVHVAKLAGIPEEVIKNAEKILKIFESNSQSTKKDKNKKNNVINFKKEQLEFL